jgi:predicted RNA-binding protein with PIN domain
MQVAMKALFLIDGYNLLHAMGALGEGERAGPLGLRKARHQLLSMLLAVLPDTSSGTVVFDAANAPPGLDPEQRVKGIHVIFARAREEADDVIERLIRQASAPKQLHVVSDDHRIQQAATRRHCIAWNCETFLDWAQRQRHKRPEANQVVEKKDQPSVQEMAAWLVEFAHVEKDPSLRKAFESFDFED